MQRIPEAEEEARPSVYSVSLTWLLLRERWLNHALLSDELELDIDEGTKVGLALSTHDGLGAHSEVNYRSNTKRLFVKHFARRRAFKGILAL